jgi:ABC-type ATPase involved in cell division
VAVARALVKRPELVLADEPTGNLDRDNAREIAALMRELNREGHTLVMSTHDAELAASCARRTMRLHYGRIAGGDPATGEPGAAGDGEVGGGREGGTL